LIPKVLSLKAMTNRIIILISTISISQKNTIEYILKN